MPDQLAASEVLGYLGLGLLLVVLLAFLVTLSLPQTRATRRRNRELARGRRNRELAANRREAHVRARTIK